jgi:hypothetical protein
VPQDRARRALCGRPRSRYRTDGFGRTEDRALVEGPQIAGGEAVVGRLSVLGALMLYLDFLNLYLFPARIFGRCS